ncbi:MAG: carboxymuconolactone decarboxylase family protein [Myxococcota bacterium]
MAEGDDRLEPATAEQMDPRTREILGETLAPVASLEGGDPSSGGPLEILRTIAHHPRILEPFLGFAATLATRGVLARRESELLALRAAWNCGSAFEWGHHVRYARAAGLGEQEIERVVEGPAAAGWSERDRLLLEVADELHRGQDVADATWRRMRERFDNAQLVEIPFVVGIYTMLSMLAKSTGVPLEEDLPPLPRG